ncbi:hypothetical protein IFT59_07655 [Rhizobium sp. CFBP 8752]|uniref:hypothetical protein n=1 Tax=Rhizobium sp. CFBP 8752 TaxID=2775301 RepID=UPI00177DCF1F|nr:hypothetical protein [Rhizobium sp. CFBP 8752]MBD8663127.1 hypothetical protein [Rhizobium sp. CFBP 8752]
MNEVTVSRANAAKRLKGNADFLEITAAIEADIFASFRSVSINDSERLATVHALSHGFKLLNDRIAKYIEAANYEASAEQLFDE